MLYGIDYMEKDGVFFTKCTAQPDDIELMVQDHWVVISGYDMIIRQSVEEGDDDLCVFAFIPSVDDYWVLGQAFYSNYYVIHEPDEL